MAHESGDSDVVVQVQGESESAAAWTPVGGAACAATEAAGAACIDGREHDTGQEDLDPVDAERRDAVKG